MTAFGLIGQIVKKPSNFKQSCIYNNQSCCTQVHIDTAAHIVQKKLQRINKKFDLIGMFLSQFKGSGMLYLVHQLFENEEIANKLSRALKKQGHTPQSFIEEGFFNNLNIAQNLLNRLQTLRQNVQNRIENVICAVCNPNDNNYFQFKDLGGLVVNYHNSNCQNYFYQLQFELDLNFFYHKFARIISKAIMLTNNDNSQSLFPINIKSIQKFKDKYNDCLRYFNINDQKCQKLCQNQNILAFKFETEILEIIKLSQDVIFKKLYNEEFDDILTKRNFPEIQSVILNESVYLIDKYNPVFIQGQLQNNEIVLKDINAFLIKQNVVNQNTFYQKKTRIFKILYVILFFIINQFQQINSYFLKLIYSSNRIYLIMQNSQFVQIKNQNNLPEDTISCILWIDNNKFAVSSWDNTLRIYELLNNNYFEQIFYHKFNSPITTFSYFHLKNSFVIALVSKEILLFSQNNLQTIFTSHSFISKIVIYEQQNCLVLFGEKFAYIYLNNKWIEYKFEYDVTDTNVVETSFISCFTNKKIAQYGLKDLVNNKNIQYQKNRLDTQYSKVAYFDFQKFLLCGADGRVSVNVMNIDKDYIFKAHNQNKLDTVLYFQINDIQVGQYQNHTFCATCGSDGFYNIWNFIGRDIFFKQQFNSPVTNLSYNIQNQMMIIATGYDWSHGIWGFQQQQERPNIYVHIFDDNVFNKKTNQSLSSKFNQGIGGKSFFNQFLKFYQIINIFL